MHCDGWRKNLGARGKEAIFFGIKPQSKGYFTLCQKTGEVKTSWNVSFPQEIKDEQNLPLAIRKPIREEKLEEQSSDKDNEDMTNDDPGAL